MMTLKMHYSKTMLTHYAGLAIVLTALAGCSGTAANTAPTTASLPQAAAPSTRAWAKTTAVMPPSVAPPHALTRRSWMLPEAKTDDLLYVSDESYNAVFVFAWPKLKLVGVLTGSGFDLPQGLCTDAVGDVFVANFAGYDVLEFAHGGTTPIATLQDEGSDTQYFAAGCAVNPKNGDLAVTNDGGEEGGDNPAWGNVAIFKNASGTPTFYSNGSDIAYEYFPTYDDNGNLYIDGRAFSTYAYQLAELPMGSSTFNDISISGATLYYPGGLAWDGSNLILGDQRYNDIYQAGFYRVSVSGSVGTVQSGALLGVKYAQGKGPACDVAQFIYDEGIVGSDYEWCEHTFSSTDVWKYPSGRRQKQKFGPFAPIGTALSLAQ
jgi:hypothetical protein